MMLWFYRQLPKDAKEREVIVDCEATVIEEYVMIRTETEQVVERVRTIVWTAKRTNMSCFHVWAG